MEGHILSNTLTISTRDTQTGSEYSLLNSFACFYIRLRTGIGYHLYSNGGVSSPHSLARILHEGMEFPGNTAKKLGQNREMT